MHHLPLFGCAIYMSLSAVKHDFQFALQPSGGLQFATCMTGPARVGNKAQEAQLREPTMVWSPFACPVQLWCRDMAAYMDAYQLT